MALGDSKTFFTTDMNKDQCKDTGMAMVLILLLIGYFTKTIAYYHTATIALLVTMTIPRLFYPIAIFWFGLSNVMGAVMSKVILSLVFILVVVPIGIFRKVIGKDAMMLKSWKKGTASVMKVRNHTFTAEDLEKPY